MPSGQFGEDLRALRAAKGNRPPLQGDTAAPVKGQEVPESATALDTLNDFLTGIAKGGGDTVIGLGNAVHSTPLLGQLTDALAKLVGPEGTNPDTAFKGASKQMESTNTAQALGKGAEQVGEFFLPAGPARLAVTEQLAKRIPNALSPGAMRLANKGAAYAGRVGGEAASAAGVSALHGEKDPQAEAGVAAGGAVGTEALTELTKLLLTPIGRKIAPILLSGSALAALPNFAGLGASMGMYSAIRKPIDKALGSPGAGQMLKRGARQVGEKGTRLATGMMDQYRAGRRKLPEDEQ